MTENRMWRRGVVIALVAALAATPAAAFAQTDEAPARDVQTTDEAQTDRVTDRETDRHSDRFEEAKAHALRAIARRLETIEHLQAAIRRNGHVNDDHAETLLRDLADAADGLAALAREIEATETPEELRPLVESIVVDFRIYVLVVPKVHEVLASDTMVSIAARLGEFASKLGEIIARAKEAGLDVGEAERLLEEMERLIAEGARTAGPVAESVIDLQPEDWPDPAQGLLREGHESLHAAASSLRRAHQTGVEIVKILRELIGGHDRPTDVARDRPTDAAGDA